MILIIPRLSSNLSDRLSARIYHDVRTSNPVVIGYGDITLEELLDGDGGKEGIDQYPIYNSFLVTKQYTVLVSIPLRPSSNPKNKSLGSLFVCLKLSNPEGCAKLALSHLIIDCGEAVDRSGYKIENIDMIIKNSETVMKSNLPKLFRDAVPTLDAFSNAIERIADVRMIYILLQFI